MKRSHYIVLLFLCLSMLSRKRTYAQDSTPFADQNVDDLEDVSDAFQESFFEALKQKGIENHERAITALNACIKLEPFKSVLFFERAKNYQALKQWDAAERDLLKSLEIKENQEDVLETLYDVYYKKQDLDKAESTIQKLIPFNSQYKEDLARLYLRTKRYDEAVTLLDDLDAEKGKDVYRQLLRDRIYKLSGNTTAQTLALEKNINADPNNKQEYLKLIYVYSEQGNSKKAYETALKLQKIDPQADEVQLALYKFHLENEKTEEAITAMNRVFKSKRLGDKAKHRVLNDFLMFINKTPAYQSSFEEAIAVFDNSVAGAKVYQELATYYLGKSEKSKALPYLEKALAKDPENLEIIKNTALLQLDTQQYEAAQKTTAAALELYPSQPLLYLTQGVALSNAGNVDKAIEQLEIGVDYIIDDVKMEADFYQQLGEAYAKKGDTIKSKKYLDRSKTLKSQLD